MPPDRKSTDPRAERARRAAKALLASLPPERRARAREATRIALARIKALARRERGKALDLAILAQIGEAQARARGRPGIDPRRRDGPTPPWHEDAS